jgi:hypothetical protein
MPLLNSQNQNARSGRQLGTGAMALLQLLVLFAIGAAVVRYLEWSSDAVQAEFMSATKSAFDPNHSGESSVPIQRVKGRSGCDRDG